MRTVRTVHPLLAALLTLMAVTPASPQGVIKLPIVAEITGGGASVGAMWRDAVNLAVEDINKKGGSLDRPSFIVEVKDQKSVVTKTVGMLGGPYNTRPCK